MRILYMVLTSVRFSGGRWNFLCVRIRQTPSLECRGDMNQVFVAIQSTEKLALVSLVLEIPTVTGVDSSPHNF